MYWFIDYLSQRHDRDFMRCIPDGLGIDELGNLPLGDHSVVDIQSAVLPLDWAVQVQYVAEPIIRRTSLLELLRAQGMWDVLDGIAQAMRVVVRGVNAPLCPGAMMSHVFDAIRHRVHFALLQNCSHAERRRAFFEHSILHVLKASKTMTEKRRQRFLNWLNQSVTQSINGPIIHSTKR